MSFLGMLQKMKSTNDGFIKMVPPVTLHDTAGANLGYSLVTVLCSSHNGHLHPQILRRQIYFCGDIQISNIPQEMLHSVSESMLRRMNPYLQRGGHFQHFL